MNNSLNTNEFFNAVIGNDFEEGWHEVVCDDNHGSLLIKRDTDGRGPKFYIIEQYDFSERKGNRPTKSFWLQIGDQIGWSNRDRAESNRLIGAMFGVSDEEAENKNHMPHELAGKKVRVLIRVNHQTNQTEVVDFMPLK